MKPSAGFVALTALTVLFGFAAVGLEHGSVQDGATPKSIRTRPATSIPIVTTPRILHIEPTSGPVGTIIRVQGGGCPPPGGAIAAVARDGTELEGAQAGGSDASGSWSVEHRMFAGLSPRATYVVTASCYVGPGMIGFTYEPQPFDLTP